MSSSPSLNKINYLNVAAYAVNVFVTYLVGNGGLPGSKSNNELSEKYQTLVTPVGWAFSIWGIIFLSQAVYVVAQVLEPFRAVPLVQQGVAMNYVYVCIAQSVWGFVFGYEFIEFSAVCMITILYFLVRTVVSEAKTQDETSTRDFWLMKFPFSIHCGWIVAASFVNISVVVVKYKASANVQYFTALASLATILVISAYTLCKKEFVIPTVLSWATFGIYSELGSPNELIATTFDQATITFVRNGAGVASLIIIISTVAKALFDYIRNRSPEATAAEQAYLRANDDGSIGA